MKILGYDIKLNKISNVDKKQPRRTKIKIVQRQLLRQKQDIQDWRSATDDAERKTIAPNRLELTRIYKDVDIDSHLSSLVGTILNKCVTSNFWLENESGIDGNSTDKINTKWFRDFIRHTVDSKFWGHSLIMLGDIIDDGFPNIGIVPREHVIPELNIVKKEVNITPNSNPRSQDQDSFIDYTHPSLNKWYIPIGDKEDLGIYHKATPWALWKKNSIIAWTTYSDLFGHPIRVGKTDILDPEKLANMDNMMKNMGSAAYGIFDPDDIVEFVEARNEDAYQVFMNFIDIANKEMSKLVLGQTMTTEDGSSRSQSEVHERVLNDYITSMKWFVANAIQNELIPRLEFHGIIPSGLSFVWDNQEKISLKEKFDFVIKLKNAGYNVPEDYILENFKIPVEIQEPIPFNQISNKLKATTVATEVYNLYKGFPHNSK